MAIKSFTRSTIENNIFYRSMLAGNTAFEPSDEDILAEEVLTSSQAGVEFTSLNSTYGSTYQHLQVRMTSRSARNTGGNNAFRVQLNSDTGSNYAWHTLYGDGSSAASTAGTSATSGRLGATLQNNSTADAFGASVIDLLDPFETTKNTTIRSMAGFTAPTGGQEIALSSVLWNNTAAVTTIKIYADGFDWLAGSRFTLIGLK